jgi:single-strand DNA-binding protein
MLQKVEIIGNVGNVPQMRYMPDGTAVTNFSVATNKRWKDGAGNEQSLTTWFRVSTWGKMAETMNQYLEVGTLVYVEGELQPDAATGGPKTFVRSDNTVGAAYEVKANVVKFLSKKEAANGTAVAASPVAQSSVPASEDDDIPF